MNPTDDKLRSAIPAGPIGSRADFQGAVRAMVASAEGAGVRQLWWVSPDFADWPLDEPALLDALSHWARAPGAHLTWVSHDFERVRRAMPRLTRWRQTFAHVLSCRSPLELAGSDMPTLLLADHRVVLRLLDRERVRGWVSHEGADVQRAHEEIDVILQRSSEAFPAVTLGL
ncbi:hypothetical protein [Ideonella sp.]|uniref:DUF7931 domain-containing protein n=1 Tax=Ideonella sp. TaxID=1929293 RepID=UPI002B4A385D|nr:hypothetical protein [Ideonella sp.]HJV70403.1 hypothetical protein [Ideonella sp.]